VLDGGISDAVAGRGAVRERVRARTGAWKYLLGACDEDDFAGEVGEVALRLELGRREGEHGVVGVWLHHLGRIL
jgi:hypothetical protein